MKRKERLRTVIDSLVANRKAKPEDIEAQLMLELEKLAKELTQ